MKAVLAEWQSHWLSRRLPAARTVQLTQRRLFIFPTRAGFLFLLALMLMLLMAINYQSNLIYGLTFWLGTLFVVAIHVTHGNLSGLTVVAAGAEPCFLGEQAAFRLRLVSHHKLRRSVSLGWPGCDRLVDISAGEVCTLSLGQQTTARGWHRPPRLTVETTYPLGLLRCWSYVLLDQPVLVWPQPMPAPPPPREGDTAYGVAQSRLEAGSDLEGYRLYRDGDRPSHIDWRGLARGQAVQVSTYREPMGNRVWLDWTALAGTSLELRLSQLCQQALDCHRAGDAFGLRLPDQTIPIGSGQAHLEAVLTTLALYSPKNERTA